jgi:hypothetical protein
MGLAHGLDPTSRSSRMFAITFADRFRAAETYYKLPETPLKRKSRERWV